MLYSFKEQECNYNNFVIEPEENSDMTLIFMIVAACSVILLIVKQYFSRIQKQFYDATIITQNEKINEEINAEINAEISEEINEKDNNSLTNSTLAIKAINLFLYIQDAEKMSQEDLVRKNQELHKIRKEIEQNYNGRFVFQINEKPFTETDNLSRDDFNGFSIAKMEEVLCSFNANEFENSSEFYFKRKKTLNFFMIATDEAKYQSMMLFWCGEKHRYLYQKYFEALEKDQTDQDKHYVANMKLFINPELNKKDLTQGIKDQIDDKYEFEISSFERHFYGLPLVRDQELARIDLGRLSLNTQQKDLVFKDYLNNYLMKSVDELYSQKSLYKYFEQLQVIYKPYKF